MHFIILDNVYVVIKIVFEYVRGYLLTGDINVAQLDVVLQWKKMLVTVLSFRLNLSFFFFNFASCFFLNKLFQIS